MRHDKRIFGTLAILGLGGGLWGEEMSYGSNSGRVMDVTIGSESRLFVARGTFRSSAPSRI
jgi:hypothetical protein